jgi:hypothetical protein
MYDTKLREELTELESAKLEIARLKMQIKLGKPVTQVPPLELTAEMLECLPSREARSSTCGFRGGFADPRENEYLKIKGSPVNNPYVEMFVWYAPGTKEMICEWYDVLTRKYTETRKDLY